ncbi:MAG: hypothetical protein U0R44_01325 [Candidatus Micrarchaeia archaeon]
MERLRRPGRTDAPDPGFSRRFEEENGRWRLRQFISGRIHVIEGAEFSTYKATLNDGVGEEELHAFALKSLGGREIPPLMPEAAGDRALKLFRAAEEAGLVRLEKVHSSPIPAHRPR